MTNAYQDAIHSGKVYFLNKTNEVIKANTITDIQSATDIDGLQDKSAALKEQLKFVRDNKEIVYSQANVKDYTKQINDLVKKYNERVRILQTETESTDDQYNEAPDQAASSSQESQSDGDSSSTAASS